MGIDPSRGFVAIPRGLTDWEWYSEPNTARLFIHLLLTSNWQEKQGAGRHNRRLSSTPVSWSRAAQSWQNSSECLNNPFGRHLCICSQPTV